MNLLWHRNYVDLHFGIVVKLLLSWPLYFQGHCPWPWRPLTLALYMLSLSPSLPHPRLGEGGSLRPGWFWPVYWQWTSQRSPFTRTVVARVKQFSAVVVRNYSLVLVCIVASEIDVAPPILLRNFIARQSCGVQLCTLLTATLLHKQTEQTWLLVTLLMTFLHVV